MCGVSNLQHGQQHHLDLLERIHKIWKQAAANVSNHDIIIQQQWQVATNALQQSEHHFYLNLEPFDIINHHILGRR